MEEYGLLLLLVLEGVDLALGCCDLLEGGCCDLLEGGRLCGVLLTLFFVRC